MNADSAGTQNSKLVLKIGGNELDDPAFVAELTRVVARLRPAPVLVHGGGKEIGLLQKALGGQPRFVGLCEFGGLDLRLAFDPRKLLRMLPFEFFNLRPVTFLLLLR